MSLPVASVECALLSRFRGALLGLALSSVPFNLGAQGWECLSEEKRSAEKRISLWELSLGLLRHHDDWETRWQWLVSVTEPSCLTRVQALIMGELLERVLCDLSIARPYQPLVLDTKSEFSGFTHSGFTYLENRLSRYDLPTEAQRYYQMTFTCIADDLLPRQGQDAFIIGVLCGLQQSSSYGLAVQTAAQFGQLATIVAGLLSGAMGAEVALPVLWQLSDRATTSDRTENLTVNYLEVVAIADCLFNQWAGVLSV